MRETAAQILLRTALRFYKIRHLELETVKHLMAMSEADFEREYIKRIKQTA